MCIMIFLCNILLMSNQIIPFPSLHLIPVTLLDILYSFIYSFPSVFHPFPSLLSFILLFSSLVHSFSSHSCSPFLQMNNFGLMTNNENLLSLMYSMFHLFTLYGILIMKISALCIQCFIYLPL